MIGLEVVAALVINRRTLWSDVPGVPVCLPHDLSLFAEYSEVEEAVTVPFYDKAEPPT